MNIQKYIDLFEYKQEDDALNPKFKEGFWSFKTFEGYEYRKLSELIRESSLDEDSAYTFTVEALQAMQDIGEVTAKHDLEDISSYSEAPIYTSELVDWMGKGNNWTFIDDVISDNGDFDSNTSIIRVIMVAYTRAWEEHYYKVLEAIK